MGMAKLTLHRGSGQLAGTVGGQTVKRFARLGMVARQTLSQGSYRFVRAAAGQTARGIIAILKAGERAIIIEGGYGASRGIIIEGGHGETRSIIIEGGRGGGGEQSIIVEGGHTGGAERSIIVEGGLEWLGATTSGSLEVVG